MGEEDHTLGGPGRESAARGGPVASTGCLTVFVLLVLAVVVGFPALLWTAGIACGGR